jgi:hypothetical protein
VLVPAAAVRAKFSQWITFNYARVILVRAGWLAAPKPSALAARLNSRRDKSSPRLERFLHLRTLPAG